MTSSIKPEVHHVSIRRQTDEDRARAMCNMHKKFGEDRTCSSEDDRGQTNTHTQIHTDRLITILHSPTGGGVIISCYSNGSISSIASTAKTDSSIRQMPGGVNVHPQCTPPHLTHSTWANAANFCPKRHFNRFIRFCAVVPRMQKSFVLRCFSIRRNPPPPAIGHLNFIIRKLSA